MAKFARLRCKQPCHSVMPLVSFLCMQTLSKIQLAWAKLSALAAIVLCLSHVSPVSTAVKVFCPVHQQAISLRQLVTAMLRAVASTITVTLLSVFSDFSWQDC